MLLKYKFSIVKKVTKKVNFFLNSVIYQYLFILILIIVSFFPNLLKNFKKLKFLLNLQTGCIK